MKDKKRDPGTVYMSNGGRVTPMEEQDGAQQDVDALSVAAEEMMAAFEARDVNALKEALSSFVQMCDSSDEE